jgi:glucan phosphoethanolaminetransferase (alkaline phosphatase superfamily)
MLAISLPLLLPGIILLRHGTIDYRQDETSEAKNSGWWWLLPIFFSLPGGIIAWAIIKKHNWRQARNMLTTGILLTLLVSGVLSSFYKAPPQQNPHVSSNTTIPAQSTLLTFKAGDVSNISFSLSH